MRFIPLVVAKPELQMAIDEAILRARMEGRVPDTVRLYAFSPSSITIGRFQSVRHDVNLEEARRLGIPVVRRITGGGSVFHDEFGGEITYSVVIGEDYHPALRNVEESYRYLAGPLVDALEELGLDAGFSGLNDIVANGKKISGSAQTRRKGVILQHGTFMYSTRLEVLARVLRVSKAKLSDKGVSSIWERVTTLEREGIKMNRWEAYELLKEKFSAAFGPEEGELTDYELELAERLVEEKYGNPPEWNEMR